MLSGRSNRRVLSVVIAAALLCGVVLCGPGVSAQQRRRAAEGEPRVVPVASAISAIRRELYDPRMTADGGLPRDEINFAEERNWAVTQEQLKRAFLRPMDQDPTIDAYIKWQMLGFKPDFASYSFEELNRLFSTMPEYWRQPEVLFRQSAQGVTMTFQTRTGLRGPRPVVGNGAIGFDPTLSFVAGGSGVAGGISGTTIGESFNRNDVQLLAERRRTEVRRANAQLQIQRDAVSNMNETVKLYRLALIERLPEEGGVKLRGKMRDVAGLIEAGDDEMDTAMDELLDMAEAQSGDPTVSPDMRAQLVAWARQLGTMGADVVQSLAYDGGGWAINLVDRRRIDLDKVETLVQLVREPPQVSQ